MAQNFDNAVFNYNNYENAGWRIIRPFAEESINAIPVDLVPGQMPRVSVPSPFARLELIQKAFGNVSSLGKAADARDRMLVSQALDIMQMVFEGPKDPNLKVTKWYLHGATDRMISQGKKLEEDNKPGLKLLGNTLREYAAREKYGLRDSDQKDDKEPVIYILSLGDLPLAMTSPTSIFLPTPNYKEKRWGEHFIIEGKLPIFSRERQLIDRDPEFVKYLMAWWEDFKRNNNGVPESLQEFGRYMSRQLDEISNREDFSLRNEIDTLSSSPIANNYEEASIANETLEILGNKFYKIRPAAEESYIRNNSDLILNLGGKTDDFPPMVLSTNIDQTQLKYTSTTSFWDSKNSGLDYNDDALRNREYNRRTLPNGKTYKGGFIYEHDLLADQLWMLPYNLNDEKFDKVMISNEPDGYSFLPPVTPLFFKFFDIEYLKKAVKMDVKSKSRHEDKDEILTVTVTLDIPVRGGIVKFKKIYTPVESITEAQERAYGIETQANGLVMEVPVALTVFPFVKFDDPKMNEYALQLVREPDFDSKLQMELEVFGRDNDDTTTRKLDVSKAWRRGVDGLITVKNYDVDGAEIDYFKIKLGNSDGIIMPKWGEPYRGGVAGLYFAFDFGTSNTYVAVSDHEGKDNADMHFELPMNLLVSTMSEDPGEYSNDIMVKSFNDYVSQDILPYSRMKRPFPLRSVLSTSKKDLDGNSNEREYKIPFLKSSIPFVIGYEDYGQADNRIIHNLKWLMDNQSNKDKKEDAKRVPAFINELMFLARAYAVSKDAKLEDCKVIWTYPVSMKRRQKNNYRDIWEEAYRKYFNPTISDSNLEEMVKSIPESVAPMFKQKKQLDGVGLSIDIGGGTCDVVIYNGQDEDKWKIASFRFGAERIFGIDLPAEDVPMVRDALAEIRDEISKYAKSRPDLATRSRIQDIANKLPSSSSDLTDVTSALFALEDQPLLKDIKDSVSFNKWLQKHYEYHYLIYFYYGGILYYITRMMQYLNETDDDDIEYDEPEMVFFSGSGSKILNIISEGKTKLLSELTEVMLNHYSKEAFDIYDFEVKMSNEPKQVTARGALSGDSRDMERFANIKEKKSKEEGRNYEIKYFLIDEIDKKGKNELKVEDAKSFKEQIVDSVIDYLELFESFVDKNQEEYDLDTDSVHAFINRLKKRDEWNRRRLEKIVVKELNSYEEGDEVPDSPFFAVLQSLLFKELRNDKDSD